MDVANCPAADLFCSSVRSVLRGSACYDWLTGEGPVATLKPAIICLMSGSYHNWRVVDWIWGELGPHLPLRQSRHPCLQLARGMVAECGVLGVREPRLNRSAFGTCSHTSPPRRIPRRPSSPIHAALTVAVRPYLAVLCCKYKPTVTWI